MSNALPADVREDQVSADEPLTRAGALLREALELLDSAKAPPEIGALVQSALDALDNNLDA